MIAAKAKENQQIHGGTAPGKTLSQNSAKVIDTRKELSKLAGVSLLENRTKGSFEMEPKASELRLLGFV